MPRRLAPPRPQVVRSRSDAEELEDHKLPYIQDAPECPDLLSAVRQAKPTVLIGLSDGAPPWAFTREVCEEMARISPRPLLLPMSSRDAAGAPGGAELAAADAYAWTGGAAFFADCHADGPVALPGGGVAHPSRLDTVYVFPGVGLGSLMSRCTRLREDMFVEAAKALSRLVTGGLWRACDCVVAKRRALLRQHLVVFCALGDDPRGRECVPPRQPGPDPCAPAEGAPLLPSP